MEYTNPVVLFFENVIGVADYSKDDKEAKQEPAVKVPYSFQPLYNTI